MADPSSNRKSQLSAAKRALLAQRLKGKAKATTPAIPRRPADVSVPLSFSQQRLWFLYQFEPDNPFYNVPFGLTLKGTLDVAALEQVMQTITQRHEILRTTFTDGDSTGEHPQQIIHPESATTLQQIDLSAFGEEAWTEAERVAQKEAQAPFDLSQGPLCRVTLLTLADQEFILLVTLHHIISDVWSTGVLVQEMATLYHVFSQGKSNPLSPLPIQYADFTLWQRQRLQGERLEKRIRYWQQQFSTPPPVLQLPTDHPRPAVQTFHGNHRDFILPAELTTALQELSKTADATLFMTLLAAFKVLLYRYTGQSDITVGSPIANRNEAAIEGLIGLFMNTLALRTQLGNNPKFCDLLHQVREVALGAYSHQDLPFEKLIEILRLPRNLSHPPLFQVMMILQNAPSPTLQLPGLTLSGLDLVNTTAKFDLTLIVIEIEDRLQCILEYNTDLFEEVTIDRLASHFHTLLMGIVANPDTRLHDLPLLTTEESAQLHQWTQTETQTLPKLCLHQLFETQVEKTPEATAVVFEQTSLTYGNLNQQANRLAHHLQSLGVGPEILVGICAERSLEMLVGLLAILKAGGAYVPMDPSYPGTRLQFMLSDAKISVLLTQTHLLDRLPSLDAKIVLLDRDESNIAQLSSEPLSNEITPDHLAYVIYTSGSTGRPKGVMIPHRGLVNYLSWATQAYNVATGGGAPVHSSLGFDATITGLWAPLLVGKPVVLLSPQQEVEALCQTLQANQQYSLVKLTPAHLELLNQMLPPETLAHQTQALVIGGEALMGHQLTFWQTHAPKTRLINEYGPTETVVGCCVYETDETTDLTGAIPIGRPIANTQLYVLDAYQQQVPVGVTGELYIGGSGVARGYLNRPNLTREKFIDNPFGEGRLYKTGDLVRYRPDGVLDYLGRIDHQVKIRGFRIELGEIETALLQHAQIREAVAIARQDNPDQKQLVAYLTLRTSDPEQQAPSISDLRQWLQEQLPDYMIPSAFVWLDHIPLTPNGKVDRQALPAPQLDRSSLTAPFTAPRSQLEQQLATIWNNVLDVDDIGIDDNFFELGGDSILSLQIITQATQTGLKLTLKQLFQHQTIRTLAPVVELISSAEQGPVTGPVPLTLIQQQLLSHPPEHRNQWCQFLHLKLDYSDSGDGSGDGSGETLSLEDIRTAIHHLLNHHDALRMTFKPDIQAQGAVWSQHNGAPVPSGPVPSVEDRLVMVQTALEEELDDAISTAINNFQEQIDLSKGPLIQAVLLPSADTQHLLFIAHQLIIDQTSWYILTEDLQTLLQQQQKGTPLRISAKTHSFQQWAKQLDEYSQSLPLQQLPKQTPLPVDFPDGTTTSLTVNLGTETTQDLLQRVPLAYRTYTHEVLLTALVQTYANWTEQSQLTVDLAHDRRGHALEDMDVSRTVGWFETLGSITFELTNSDDLGNALKVVKEQQRQGIQDALNHTVNLNQNKESETPKPVATIYFSHSEPLQAINKTGTPKFQVIETATLNRGGPYELQIDSNIVAGNLQLRWTYSESLYPTDVIETLVQQFFENLRSLITHCLSPDAGGYTPSDFPLTQLDQATLDHLLARYPNLEDCYPLAPIQQGFLFHALYAPNDGMYITQICCRLQGELDIAALQQTWQLISDRHPILRTAFVWKDLPQPLQVVQQQVVVPWQVNDWRSQSSQDQKNNLNSLLEQDRTTGFKPHVAPLMRPTLVQVADDVYDIIWSCHHMLIDGWSMPMVIQEIFTLYESLVQGQKPVLPERRPYRDYIAWLSGQDLSTAEDFWTSLLAGFQTPTPLGYQKSQETPPNHEIQGLTLKSNIANGIQTLAQRHRITLNTLIQGIWSILLGHISGQTDIVFGATTAGRPPTLAGVDTMVGLFINTLPVRVKLTSDTDIMTWMQAIQTQRSEARQYEYSPLNQIQKWSEIPTGTSLFDSLIVFENYRVAAATSNQTKLTILSEDAARNNSYPLTLRVLPREEIVLEIMSDRTCFAAEVTDRWLHHLNGLLQWLVEHPDTNLGDWQNQLSELDRQWQKQQAQTQAKSSLKKLRKTRRKAVRASQEDS